MKKNNNYIPSGIEIFGDGKPRKFKAPSFWERSTIEKDDRFCLMVTMAVMFFLMITITVILTRQITFVQDTVNAHLLEEPQIAQITGTMSADKTMQVTQTLPVLESREFTITGYCICLKCCGKLDGITASGATVTEGVTCAADWSVLGVGSIVDIEGIGIRTVQDKGSKVKGDHIDVYMLDHKTAIAFGRQTRTVTIIKEVK